jgi:glucosylceramidase
MALSLSTPAQSKADWITSSPREQWKVQKGFSIKPLSGVTDVEIQVSQRQQTVEGFGTCFNERGWTSLQLLSGMDRERILRELFAPGVGASSLTMRRKEILRCGILQTR